MARVEKEVAVKELKEKFQRAKGVILTDFKGLDVQDITELRTKLKKAKVEYKVTKNTLSRIAIREAGFNDLGEFLEGPTALAFSYNDPLLLAKIIVDYTKEHENLKVKGGLVEGKVINADEVRLLASLPGREVLLAQVLSNLQSPLARLVNALNAPLQQLLLILKGLEGRKAA